MRTDRRLRVWLMVLGMLNAFDAVNFTPTAGVGGTTLSNYQITGADSGRVIQLVARYNW